MSKIRRVDHSLQQVNKYSIPTYLHRLYLLHQQIRCEYSKFLKLKWNEKAKIKTQCGSVQWPFLQFIWSLKCNSAFFPHFVVIKGCWRVPNAITVTMCYGKCAPNLHLMRLNLFSLCKFIVFVIVFDSASCAKLVIRRDYRIWHANYFLFWK